MADLEASETWTDAARKAAQRERLARMLPEIARSNAFYRPKLGSATADAWSSVPFTTKGELSDDQAGNPPFGTNLTYPLHRYTRLHQTSGTTGKPLLILDTAEIKRIEADD